MASKNGKKMRVKLSGFAELVDRLSDLETAVEKELGKLTVKAANIVKEAAIKNAPRGITGRLKNSIRIYSGSTKNKSKNTDKKYANVSIGSKPGETTEESGYYATFYEFGTSRQPARPFLRPAFTKSKRKIRAVMTDGIKEIITKKRV